MHAPIVTYLTLSRKKREVAVRCLSAPRTCPRTLQGISCQDSETKVGPGYGLVLYKRGLGSG